MRGSDAISGEGRQDWATPAWVVEAAASVCGVRTFDLDVCATGANAKCARFITPEQDAFVAPWLAGSAWCNPPYSYIPRWVARACHEVEMGHCGSVVMLLPARTSEAWFHDLSAAPQLAEVAFLRPRISFVGATGSPSWGSMFVRFGGQMARWRAVDIRTWKSRPGNGTLL